MSDECCPSPSPNPMLGILYTSYLEYCHSTLLHLPPTAFGLSLLEEWHKNCPPMTAFHSGLWLQRLAPFPGKRLCLSRCMSTVVLGSHSLVGQLHGHRQIPPYRSSISIPAIWLEGKSILSNVGAILGEDPFICIQSPFCHRPRPILFAGRKGLATYGMRMLHRAGIPKGTCSAPLLSCEDHPPCWPHLHLPTDSFVMPIKSCL